MRKITLYRDDSTAQVVIERAKTFFWTAGGTVLVVAVYDDGQGDGGSHHYVHWPRERFAWFRDEPAPAAPPGPRKAPGSSNGITT